LIEEKLYRIGPFKTLTDVQLMTSLAFLGLQNLGFTKSLGRSASPLWEGPQA